MKHDEIIKKSFSKQAERFSAYHMSRAEYTDYLVQKIGADGTEKALEVAAGTCICGRALAPHVKEITCLDLTEEMLSKGREAAEKENIGNISFRIGNAEHLPYGAENFDLVITRLSLHHFPSPEIPFCEMKRVLKKGGKLVIWDMEACEESLRSADDEIEKMRDPSHCRILSRKELEGLFGNDFEMLCEETKLIPVPLDSWMNLTDTPENARKVIRKRMEEDLGGGEKTGFDPYRENGRILFHHRWLLLIGKKK